MLWIKFTRTSCEITFKWMLRNMFDTQSTLAQVIACLQAPSHYLSQYQPRSLSQFCVTRPQWVNVNIYINTLPILSFQITISTETETLEYFTDIEDPISFSFINPRCHTIIKTGIDAWTSRIMVYAAMYMLQNCIITLYHSYIYV